MTQNSQQPHEPHVPGRKRVASRAVDPAAVDPAAINHTAANPATVDSFQIIDIPDSVDATAGHLLQPIELQHLHTLPVEEAAATPVADLSMVNQRRRRTGHHRVYRWTQILSISAAAIAALSIIWTAVDEPFPGGICGAIAMVIAINAVILSNKNALAGRWRGWAIGALVFACASLIISLIHRAVVEDGPVTPTAKTSPQK